MMNGFTFGDYPYNPNMFNTNQNMLNSNQTNRSFLKGRIVSNIDEARSAIVDMDGSTTFFPCPANGCIYTKSIDLNGNMILSIFRLVKEPVQDETSAQLTNLSARVEAIENYLKGATTNEPANANTATTDVRK